MKPPSNTLGADIKPDVFSRAPGTSVRKAKTGVNRGQFQKGNTLGSSSAAVFGRKRARMDKECQTSNDTSNDTPTVDITALGVLLGRERISVGRR